MISIFFKSSRWCIYVWTYQLLHLQQAFEEGAHGEVYSVVLLMAEMSFEKGLCSYCLLLLWGRKEETRQRQTAPPPTTTTLTKPDTQEMKKQKKKCFHISGQKWRMLPSAPWMVRLCVAESYSSASWKTWPYIPKEILSYWTRLISLEHGSRYGAPTCSSWVLGDILCGSSRALL